MDELELMSDAGPVAQSIATSVATAAASSVDARPWRLRRPVLAGFVLYGALVLVLATIGWFWVREHERGRQDGLLTKVHGQSGIFALDPDRTIRVLNEEVLSQRPSDDTRRRALLVIAAAHDSARRYDEADRTYEVVRLEWPAGLPSGPLYVPWANMLVTAGRAVRAGELLSKSGATAGWDDAAEVDAVRARVAKALDASSAAGTR